MSKQQLSRNQIRLDVTRLLKNNGNKIYRPKELARQLGYKDNDSYRLFRSVLANMEEEKLVARVQGGKYMYKPRPAKLEGTLRVNPQGFGFVSIEGMEDDLFVREGNMRNALDGDRVQVAVLAPVQGDRRRECEVLRIVERHRTEVVGTFKHSGRFAFVVPDDRRITRDIYIDQQHFGEAKDGDKVIASIERYDDPKAAPEGRILRVIGDSNDPAIRVLSLALSLDVRAEFPPEVTAEADQIPAEVPIEEIERRLDLRHKRIYTIDPVDAKDFDDAIHVEENEDGSFEVGVHIADVSYYVRSGTAIDREAYARGTSTYLVDRVIPMLPENLSNMACSLRPYEDKLTYSCIMQVGPKGRVRSFEIRETVIRSVHRFTYEGAQAIIEGEDPDHPLAADVIRAANLAKVLTKKRMQEGSVDFDLPEVRVVLDEEGNPIQVLRRDRKESNRLIEEFMLLANRTVAESVGRRSNPAPFVYRVHDKPDIEKIRQLAEYVRMFGYRLKLNEGVVESGRLNALLSEVKGSAEAPVIEEAALRSMAKARYSADNVGHYGLAFPWYTHFTSPIRRYPDLMAHRLLKHYANGGAPVDPAKLAAECDHCSERERVAAEAERESIKLKQVEYIKNHLGEQFNGVVTGITKFGIFVELEDILVEGLVHVRNLDDDYYEYDESTYRLIGRYSGRTFKLGDQLQVIVAAANTETREIDFQLV